MILGHLAVLLIERAEKRIGVALDYTRQIAKTDFGLLMRYYKIFGFLDPNRKVSAQLYHTARLRGAIAADGGTCVAAEINLAKTAGMKSGVLNQVISGKYDTVPEGVAAVANLADSVVGRCEDDPQSRGTIIAC